MPAVGQEGAELIVFDEKHGFARVVPRCREILPEDAFFVDVADLQSGPLVANAAALDSGCR